MSGVAGIIRLDGRRPAPADLQRMLGRLAHRGPDGAGEWCRGPAALGHRMLHTTPESLGERLPLVGPGGSVVLTADARIDNRDELIRALDRRERPAREIPDSALILSAWGAWGERCLEHLLGDYAFAVWDPRRQRLFCARDPFGVRPLYYHHQPGRLFAFASEIKALLCLPDVPRRLDETRVADFLQCSFDDQEITFYRDIRRLPAAHSLQFSRAGVVCTRYWSPDPYREARFRSDDEYAEAFRERFTEAVRCRLRSVFPVGASLSGGLDSSSIVCTARQLLRDRAAAPLHTFSLVFDDLPECDERPFIDAVLDGGGLVPHLIRGDRLSPLDELDLYLRHEDEPPWVFNMCLHWAMHRAAAEQGVRIFLDGLGGDETVGHGIYRLAELMRRGRLFELGVSVTRLSRSFHRPPLRILRRHAIRPLLPPGLLGAWAGVRGRPAAAGVRPLITAELADRVELAARLRRWREERPPAPDTVRGAHYLGLLAGIASAGFESLDRVGAAFSLEPRYPFQDRRLVEFCLAAPAEQKFRRGWTRVGLRHAMEGVLPDAVRLRPGKGDLGAQFNDGFLRFERARIEAVVYGAPDLIAPFVDIAVLRDLYRAYAVGGRKRNAELVWHPVMLALWLQRADFADRRSARGANRRIGDMSDRPELEEKGKRRPYVEPRLVVHGDVATLTRQDWGGSGCVPSVKDCGGGDGNSRLGPLS